MDARQLIVGIALIALGIGLVVVMMGVLNRPVTLDRLLEDQQRFRRAIGLPLADRGAHLRGLRVGVWAGVVFSTLLVALGVGTIITTVRGR